MKKIGLILIGIMIICNVGSVWADPTVKDILQKKLSNDQALQAVEGKIQSDWYRPEGNKIYGSTGYFWQKGEENYRLEIYDEQGIIQDTTIKNSSGTVSINDLGEIVVDDREKNNDEEYGEGDIIGDDADKFLEYFAVQIIITEGQVYTLEIKPKNQSVAYGQIDKIEEAIDYAKGTEVKSKIYDVNNTLLIETEFSEFISEDGVWLAGKKVSRKKDSQGNATVNIVVYENLKINQGIEDEKFAYEFQ